VLPKYPTKNLIKDLEIAVVNILFHNLMIKYITAMFKFTETEFSKQVGHYFPQEALAFAFNVYVQENFIFKITPPRTTKKGDYRPPTAFRPNPIITINRDLLPYEFLVVYLHEVAHYITYKEHKQPIMPHGKEWKNHYRQIFQSLLSTAVLPNEVQKIYETHLKHIKSSSTLDATLNELFYKDKTKNCNEVLVRELKPNDLFLCQKKVFRFDGMIRTRARCTMIRNHKPYIVIGHAKVIKLH